MFKYLTEHIHDTENPQTYWQHFWVAFPNSCKLLWASLQGIVHAFFPWYYLFKTPTQIIKSFKILLDTRRHKVELNKYLGKYTIIRNE